MRAAAAGALGRVGEPEEMIPVLTALARDSREDFNVRTSAAEALGRLGEAESASAILLAWGDDRKLEPWQRRRALWILGSLAAGGKPARETLARIARSRQSVRDEAWRALWNLTSAGTLA